MRRGVFPWLLASTILSGCGGSLGGSKLSTVGPHQGPLLELPDGLGTVEVVVETKVISPRLATSEVAVYFFGPKSQGALKPPPTDVAVQVYFAESKSMEKVALKPGEASDSQTRFAAIPPPGFDGMIRRGRLAARIGGREIDLPF